MSDTPMLVQCTERESGGVQCEVLLVAPGEEHAHWISEATIQRHLSRRHAFYTHISVRGVTTMAPVE